MNIMIQRYSPSVTVITRVIKSVNVNKKVASRGHLIDQSILLKDPIPEGDLVLIHRLKDIHNQCTVHVDVNGRGTRRVQTETMPSHTSELNSWIQRMFGIRNVLGNRIINN